MDRVAAQRQALADIYRAHVGQGDAYALVDFPDHANVGDSAIWLGEIAMLRAVTGRDPCYVSTWHDFDRNAFHAACPTGTLFLHGGGNLGDIWLHHQRFREQMLIETRDRPIVQLPQSIHFRDPAGCERFATAAAHHPAFTLYVRDNRSLSFARRHFACRSILAPDSAFAIGPQPRGIADCDRLMLLRTDDERCDHGALPGHAAEIVDWLVDGPDMPVGDDIATRFAQAQTRVSRGLRLLSRGRVVITDRLHGHILTSLLGIPHVVLDNDYGKIAAYMHAWSTGGGDVISAPTMADAERAADRLARAL